MPKASILADPRSTQSLRATRYEELRVALRERVGRIRAAMSNGAVQGFHSRVATLMDYRRERISRELGCVEKLSVELLLAVVALHREEDRPITADRLLALINEGQPIRLRTNGAVVIRLSDGQLFLDLQPPEPTS